MEKVRSHNLRSPFVLNTNKLITKKSLPASADFQDSLIIPSIRVSILSKAHKVPSIDSEASTDTNVYPTKLPAIYSKKSILTKRNVRYFNYSKLAHKVHSYKPLFHERHRSQNLPNPNVEDNYYRLMRSKLQLLDY